MCSQHSKDYLVTWQQLGLHTEALELLLGPLFAKLYRQEDGSLIPVPHHVPRKAMGLVGIALSHLATRLKGLEHDILDKAVENATASFAAATAASLPVTKSQPY